MMHFVREIFYILNNQLIEFLLLEKFQNNEKDYDVIHDLYKRAENAILAYEKRGKRKFRSAQQSCA